MQISFDPLKLIDADPALTFEVASKQALKARNAELKALRSQGIKAFGWTLPGQIRKYSSFGVEDGSIRNVYYINHD